MKKAEIRQNGKDPITCAAPEHVLEEMIGLRIRHSESMVFKIRRNHILDSFFVSKTLNLYYIRSNRLVETEKLKPNRIKTVNEKTDYLIESFNELELEPSSNITVNLQP